MEMFFIILLVLALALYGLGKRATAEIEYVGCVEAGATSDVFADELAKHARYEKRKIILDSENCLIDTHNYLRVIVKGDCLQPIGIVDHSQLLVYKFQNEQEKSIIKQGDVLMIHLASRQIDKIRVFDELLEDGKMSTYRFDCNGQRKDSSCPHSLSSVVGIVRYML